MPPDTTLLTTAADGQLLACPSARDTLLRHFRDYLHQVCHSLGLSTRIVPHQLRHTYAVTRRDSFPLRAMESSE